MPQLKSGKKHVRADEKKRVANHAVKANLRTDIKKVTKLVKAGKTEEAKIVLPKVHSGLDKASKKKIIHPGNAKRHKSRLSKLVSASDSK